MLSLRRLRLASALTAVAAGIAGTLTLPSHPPDASAAEPRVSVGGRVENTSSAIRYSPPWKTSRSSQDSGGSYATLTVPGSATLTFTGTGIRWVTRTSNYSGIAEVYLDGRLSATVDLYSAELRQQQVVYARRNLADTSHTIEIRRTGRLNRQSVGRRISLDAFVTLDSTPPATMGRPTPTWERRGMQVKWPKSNAADLAGYRLYRTTAGRQILLGTLPKSPRIFLDVGLAPRTAHSYRVVAVDLSGNRSGSSTATATTPAAPTLTALRYSSCPAATRPVRTSGQLYNALARAVPGDVIRLAPGRYSGYFRLARSGTASRPIWICGPKTAVVDFGDPSRSYGFTLSGVSYVTVTGMTVKNSQKGVTVTRGKHVTVSDMAFQNIGDEAVHLRINTTRSAVVGNTITRTGLNSPAYGEGVYIGTDPGTWCAYNGCQADRSNHNSIVNNTIRGTTAEAIEVKAGSSAGLISGNSINGSSLRPAFPWIAVKGNAWVIQRNSGKTAPRDGFTASYSKAAGWGGRNVFVANRATLGNASGYGVSVPRHIGNLAGCDNVTTSGSRAVNVPCQR